MSSLTIERAGDTYVARREDQSIAWTVELRLDMTGTPFREEVFWPAASVVVLAGGHDVHFLDAGSGAVVKTLSLDDDFFGHFGPADGETLYVLGWQHVTAIDKSMEVLWISKDVAVDGITGGEIEGDRIRLSAEMDPPGGWVDVELDRLTGRQLTLRRG